MAESALRIGLVAAPFPASFEQALKYVERYVHMAARGNAKIVCFPESYVPGMRGIDEPVEAHAPDKLLYAISFAQDLARETNTALILPMDRDCRGSIQNVAAVISPHGELLGYQTKNQLDPCEDDIFVPGTDRRVFDLFGITIGISICHEGFRYPETVRWAAVRGALIVFHPHCTGSNKTGIRPTEWQGRDNDYYEHAMMCRALENNVYFASINYGFTFPQSATCVIAPDGRCIAQQPYGEPGLLVADIDLEAASRRLALRYSPRTYPGEP
ncbi:carbon-nitrogen hydrolase family protein [Bradyrhizobium prioriisuperbiae]|uniref:carbon-nitrogen hydrolase family protein n=1 Tax=Bradyrhizobium prioriisuperbiae TaxID=2854389 RepID=UPI0028EAB61A|nr:carbon-nitrogen hydrolase family protein [Bradyrhizobium prioritasuperba]